MTYAKTLALSLRAYPRLYVDERDLLESLFFVDGNGYHWVGGELVDVAGRTSKQILVSVERQRKANNAERKRLMTNLPEFISKDPAVERRKEIAWREEYGSVRNLYPLSESSHISRLPDDIKPDWLEAAMRAVLLATLTMKPTPSNRKWLRRATKRIRQLQEAMTS